VDNSTAERMSLAESLRITMPLKSGIVADSPLTKAQIRKQPLHGDLQTPFRF